jgi:dTDP-L-rhamnose 4-epimerase
VKASKVLITGGAGFVGSHTADALVAGGHTVRIYDNLSKQVHPRGVPPYLPKDAEFVEGDVRDLERLRNAVYDVDVIFHFASAVGVGQSMYQIADYTSVNNLGTANLLQAILDTASEPKKIIIASSMSIYGEGRYLCADCGEVAPPLRSPRQLRERKWEAACPYCGATVVPISTNENKPLQGSSVYALSKKHQEEIALLFGRTYGIPVVALRFFNIYGPRQALSNPYTGVAAIFASRLMNRNAPVLFEDGMQMRDFVSVYDVVEANLLAMNNCAADGVALNVGSGQPTTIREVAMELAAAQNIATPLDITGKYRCGDIRHCFGDITQIKNLLGYRPRISLKQGMREFVAWLQSQIAEDRLDKAMADLDLHGLVA